MKSAVSVLPQAQRSSHPLLVHGLTEPCLGKPGKSITVVILDRRPLGHPGVPRLGTVLWEAMLRTGQKLRTCHLHDPGMRRIQYLEMRSKCHIKPGVLHETGGLGEAGVIILRELTASIMLSLLPEVIAGDILFRKTGTNARASTVVHGEVKSAKDTMGPKWAAIMAAISNPSA
jgi:hypothetical protein